MIRYTEEKADDQASQEANQAVSEEISNTDNTIQEKNQLSMYIGGATGMDGVWETDNGKSVVFWCYKMFSSTSSPVVPPLWNTVRVNEINEMEMTL